MLQSKVIIGMNEHIFVDHKNVHLRRTNGKGFVNQTSPGIYWIDYWRRTFVRRSPTIPLHERIKGKKETPSPKIQKKRWRKKRVESLLLQGATEKGFQQCY